MQTLSSVTPLTFSERTSDNASVQQHIRGRETEWPRIRTLARRGTHRPQLPPISRVADRQVRTEAPAVTRANAYREQEEAAEGFEDDETFIPTICRESEEQSRQEAHARACREHEEASRRVEELRHVHPRQVRRIHQIQPEEQAQSEQWRAYFTEQ